MGGSAIGEIRSRPLFRYSAVDLSDNSSIPHIPEFVNSKSLIQK